MYIDTVLPVLQAYGPQVSGTKCHLLRPGWRAPEMLMHRFTATTFGDVITPSRIKANSLPVAQQEKNLTAIEYNIGNGKGILSYQNNYSEKMVWFGNKDIFPIKMIFRANKEIHKTEKS